MPATNERMPMPNPGDPILAEEFKKLSRQMMRLSNVGDHQNVIMTGAGVFRRSVPKRAASPDPTGTERTLLVLGEIIEKPSEGWVTIEVQYRPPGVATLPLELGTGSSGTLPVSDMGGCVFGGVPEGDLVGLKLWAAYMNAIGLANRDAGTWIVYSMCCPLGS